MKIALIHGQSHKGSSYHIGRMIAEKVTGENKITEFFLPKDLNHFCLGCYSCIEGDEHCPFYEEAMRLVEEGKIYSRVLRYHAYVYEKY